MKRLVSFWLVCLLLPYGVEAQELQSYEGPPKNATLYIEIQHPLLDSFAIGLFQPEVERKKIEHGPTYNPRLAWVVMGLGARGELVPLKHELCMYGQCEDTLPRVFFHRDLLIEIAEHPGDWRVFAFLDIKKKSIGEIPESALVDFASIQSDPSRVDQANVAIALGEVVVLVGSGIAAVSTWFVLNSPPVKSSLNRASQQLGRNCQIMLDNFVAASAAAWSLWELKTQLEELGRLQLLEYGRQAYEAGDIENPFKMPEMPEGPNKFNTVVAFLIGSALATWGGERIYKAFRGPSGVAWWKDPAYFSDSIIVLNQKLVEEFWDAELYQPLREEIGTMGKLVRDLHFTGDLAMGEHEWPETWIPGDVTTLQKAQMWVLWRLSRAVQTGYVPLERLYEEHYQTPLQTRELLWSVVMRTYSPVSIFPTALMRRWSQSGLYELDGDFAIALSRGPDASEGLARIQKFLDQYPRGVVEEQEFLSWLRENNLTTISSFQAELMRSVESQFVGAARSFVQAIDDGNDVLARQAAIDALMWHRVLRSRFRDSYPHEQLRTGARIDHGFDARLAQLNQWADQVSDPVFRHQLRSEELLRLWALQLAEENSLTWGETRPLYWFTRTGDEPDAEMSRFQDSLTTWFPDVYRQRILYSLPRQLMQADLFFAASRNLQGFAAREAAVVEVLLGLYNPILQIGCFPSGDGSDATLVKTIELLRAVQQDSTLLRGRRGQAMVQADRLQGIVTQYDAGDHPMELGRVTWREILNYGPRLISISTRTLERLALPVPVYYEIQPFPDMDFDEAERPGSGLLDLDAASQEELIRYGSLSGRAPGLKVLDQPLVFVRRLARDPESEPAQGDLTWLRDGDMTLEGSAREQLVDQSDLLGELDQHPAFEEVYNLCWGRIKDQLGLFEPSWDLIRADLRVLKQILK